MRGRAERQRGGVAAFPPPRRPEAGDGRVGAWLSSTQRRREQPPPSPPPAWGRAIAYAEIRAEISPPTWAQHGGGQGGEAALRRETVIARFPHPNPPHVGGGGIMLHRAYAIAPQPWGGGLHGECLRLLRHRRRQFQGHGGAAAGLGHHADLPVVQLDQRLGDGKAEADAILALRG